MNPIISNLQSLKETHLKLVCFYAYFGDSLSQYELELYARTEKTPLETVKLIEKTLFQEGYLTFGEYDWETHDFSHQIATKYYAITLHLLYTTHHEWVKTFGSIAGNDNSLYSIMRTIIGFGINEQYAKISPKWFSFEMIPYLVPTITNPQVAMIALRMSEPLFHIYFEEALVYLTENDFIDTADVLPRLLANNKMVNPAMLSEQKECLALYRYYSHGEYKPTAQPRTLYTLLLEAVYAAYHQQYPKAIIYFEEAIKIRNKTAVDKNILMGILNSYCLIMSYVHQESTENIAKMQQFLRKKITENEGLLPARIVASCFSNVERKLSNALSEKLLCETSSRTAQCFGFLFASYFQTQQSASLNADKYIPQQAILRHELSAFLPLSDEERLKLRNMYGNAPLLSSIKMKQTWELVLENMLEEELKQENSQSEKRDTRMGYLIRYAGDIEVREQSLLKSGEWGSGKAISSNRYQTGQIDCMDETDKKIWSRWRKKGYHRISIEDALPELVGSNRLFSGRNAPFDPVTVTSEKPYLVIEKTGQSFKVSSNYPPIRTTGRYDATDCIIIRKDNTHYTVIPLEGRQRRYYEQLLTLGEFPLAAEKKLQDFFPKISKLVEVHSPLLKEGSTLECIDGKAIICLQVHPGEQNFNVQLYAKPLPEGKTLFSPGKGLNLVVDEKNGMRYQVKRHLSQERSNYEAITGYMEEEMGVIVNENGASLTAEKMLTLLDYIYQLPENFFVEWPEGEKLRLKKTSEPCYWNASLTSRGNWLDIEGSIQLDDETVLSMAQLLELISLNKGKYIRLNTSDYLRLSDNLRKQLNRLESVAVKNHGKMQISNFQAGLLGDDILNGELEIKHDSSLDQMRQKIAESKRMTAKLPTKLKATLRDYQLDGFQWIVRLNSWGAGACLADDMGLGKTIQTIAYLLFMAKKGASLVIAPASVVPNWRKELQRFAPALNVSILNESSDRQQTIQQAKGFDIVLSTYGLLVSEEQALTDKKWNIVCLDEAHTIKNRETKSSACAMKLQADNRLILTGTPIQNHLGELWNLFQFIIPGLLGSYDQFQQKYLSPIEQDKDKQRQLQLNRIVHPFMLRRTKQEVVEELPDKQEITLSVELSDQEMGIYEAIRRKAKAMLAEGGASVNVSALAEITKLRQAACSASLVEKKWKGECSKINLLIGLMNELKDGKNRALIFSQFTSFLDLVRQALDKAGEEYLYLDGSTPMKQREKLVQEFQQGDCPFFIISLKAGGLGLNLTGANYIIHLDPWWNPAIEQQATDRAYRIGQEQKVTAYHLVASHTIEEKIIRLHETKRNLADALLDGTEMSHKLTAKELMEMLEEQ